MPLISIETNQELAGEDILKEVSQGIAAMLNKPQEYVMVKYQHNPNMLFAGDNQPLAYLQLKSLGLPEHKTPQFTMSLCNLMQIHFDVTPERVYIEYSSPARHFWGWNNSTF